MVQLLCSTGAFLGRKNNGHYQWILESGDRIRCDGFEWMIFPMWYDRLDAIAQELRATGLPFPVLHADKSIGDAISSAPDAEFGACVDKFRVNIEAACAVGAKKVVTHIWGSPDSDHDLPRIYERVLRLREIAGSYGLDMLAENCCVIEGSPLAHLRDLQALEPDMGFTIDTRMAQFHQELPAQCAADDLWHGAVRHLHLSDYHGGLKEWKALYPIPAPGQGDVDYPAFFAHLKRVGYDATASLESPCMHEDRLDWETINGYLDYLRAGLAR